MLSKSSYDGYPKICNYYPNNQWVSGKCVCKSRYALKNAGILCYSISEVDCSDSSLVCDNHSNSECVSGKCICESE